MSHPFLHDYLKSLPAVIAVVLGALLAWYGLDRYGDELTAIDKFFLAAAFMNASWLVINSVVRKVVSQSMPSPADN